MNKDIKILRRYPVVCYLVATCVWTWGFWGYLALTALPPQSLIWKGLFVLGVSGPLFASFGLSLALGNHEAKDLLRRFAIWKFSPWYYLLALGLPPLLLWSAGIFSNICLHQKTAMVLPSVPVLVFTFFWLMIRGGPVNEEFGWRGFVLPRLLQRHSPFAATMLLGPVWALWHWPLWFLSSVPHPYWPFGLFFMMVLSMNILFTWFFLRSRGSILLAIIFHTAINTSIKFVAILPPAYPSLTPFVVWVSFVWVIALAILVVERKVWFAAPIPESPSAPRAAPGTLPSLKPLPSE